MPKKFRLNVKNAKNEQLDNFRKRMTDFMICHFRCYVGTISSKLRSEAEHGGAYQFLIGQAKAEGAPLV